MFTIRLDGNQPEGDLVRSEREKLERHVQLGAHLIAKRLHMADDARWVAHHHDRVEGVVSPRIDQSVSPIPRRPNSR